MVTSISSSISGERAAASERVFGNGGKGAAAELGYLSIGAIYSSLLERQGECPWEVWVPLESVILYGVVGEAQALRWTFPGGAEIGMRFEKPVFLSLGNHVLNHL